MSIPLGAAPTSGPVPLTRCRGIRMILMVKPLALLLNPPVYDLALYDLFLRPYGLLRIGRWLADGGWVVRFVDALDPEDETSRAALGVPVRRSDGTGKLFRMPVPTPPALAAAGRRYARYGLLPLSLRARLAEAAGSGRRWPDLVLVASGMTYWYPGVVEGMREVRRLWPEAPAVVGGVYATLLPDHAGSVTGADLVVRGEDLQPLRGFLGARGLPAPSAEVPPAPLLLAEAWRGVGVLRMSSGCPFHCDYCASGLLSPGWRPGDPQAVFEQFGEMHRRVGARSFAFYDDALLARKEQLLLPFLEQVIRSGLEAGFFVPNALHAAGIDAESARLMRRAGFREVRLGLESTEASFHEAHGRKAAPEAIGRAVRHLRQAGFPARQIWVYLLAGLPDQRAEELERSILAAAGLGVRISITEFSPVPGTALWDRCRQRSSWPIAEEPLCQNNSFQPLAWEGFTRRDMDRLKRLARSLSGSPAGPQSIGP